jgi:GNAT superfamily N-acetyltransferase
MEHTQSGRAWEGVTDRIQENLVAYYLIFDGLPGVTIVDGDVTWCTSREEAPGNQVLRSRLTAETAEQRIDQTLAQIGRRAEQVDWLVFPGCRPADLGQRLAARGMPGSPGGIWMLADLESLPADLALPHGFELAQVRDDAQLAEWARMSAAGFGGDMQVLYDAYARHGYGLDARSLHYIAYHGGEPVTTSTLLLAGGIAGLFDISTPASLRRRGYAGAITLAMMQIARQRGYRTAWTWASRMGQSVYQKAGFTTVDLGIREYRWRRPTLRRERRGS